MWITNYSKIFAAYYLWGTFVTPFAETRQGEKKVKEFCEVISIRLHLHSQIEKQG
jgi:hypothetical protein